VTAVPCIGCHHITTRPMQGRCPRCWAIRQAERDKRRGAPAQRGYDAEYTRNRIKVIGKQPWCSGCWTRGTDDNPLSADHIRPLSKGGSNDVSNLRVLCLRCNSKRGNR
jgi:5-methylcytosine-specific restriction enzyme A